jgi:hypothetical protein
MTRRRAIALLVLAVAAGAAAGRLIGGGAPGALTLAGLVALALLVSVFLPAGRRADPSAVADVSARVPEPRPPRRRPIAPPPTHGRWDEAPRA